MGSIAKKAVDTPITGFGSRLQNASTHWRGIIGVMVPILYGFVFLNLKSLTSTVAGLWFIIFWMFLIKPTHVQALGYLPMWMLPFFGVLDSKYHTSNVFNIQIGLFILGGYLSTLLNCCRFDIRVFASFLNPNITTPKKLVINASLSAWLMSIFSNRLVVTERLMDFVMPGLFNIASVTKDDSANRIRYVVSQAILSSSCIGSFVFPHGSISTLAARAFLHEAGKQSDIFNYLSFIVLSIPLSIVLFAVNLGVHIALVGPASAKSMEVVKDGLKKSGSSVPKKITPHELWAVFFTFLSILLYCTRWSGIIYKLTQKYGWSDVSQLVDVCTRPYIPDMTVAAVFMFLLSALPKGTSFIKYLKEKKQSRLPPICKPESGIIFWKYADKLCDYGYVHTTGLSLGLCSAIGSYLGPDLRETVQGLTNMPVLGGLGAILFATFILSNLMPPVPAICMISPVIIHMVDPAGFADNTYPTDWHKNMHWAAIGAGLVSNLNFAAPFKSFPSYFAQTKAKVPRIEMIKLGLPAGLLCTAVVFAFTAFVFPLLFSETLCLQVKILQSAREGGAGSTGASGAGGGGATTVPPSG